MWLRKQAVDAKVSDCKKKEIQEKTSYTFQKNLVSFKDLKKKQTTKLMQYPTHQFKFTYF